MAAPQTWAATITACCFAFTYSALTLASTSTNEPISGSPQMSLPMLVVLFAICVLMQSAVNVFDDYFDYKKGTDTLENSSNDKFDAVLVYNHVSPKAVLAYAIGLLALAGLLGIYVIYECGWIPLAIGLVGAIVVVLYAGGKVPLSHLPVGEIVSGFVMGGLIPLACCYALTGQLDAKVLMFAIPVMIGIGLINATNNTCDIEKDAAVERDTLAVRLGRKKAPRIYKAFVIVWIVCIIILAALMSPSAAPFLPLMVLGAFPVLRALFLNPLIQQSRDGAMAQIVSLNVIFAAFYCLCLSLGPQLNWLL
ncbi:MAG: prenyltransferase [Coriobacteriia bacterium]|nr:prenyltransferase [Coriobacteriia bacterium]